MGIGRNLCYTKTLFFANKGFASHMHVMSGDDDLFVCQAGTVIFEFVADDAVAFSDIFVVRVDEVEQHLAAFDMPEEAVADPRAFGRALD